MERYKVYQETGHAMEQVIEVRKSLGVHETTKLHEATKRAVLAYAGVDENAIVNQAWALVMDVCVGVEVVRFVLVPDD